MKGQRKQSDPRCRHRGFTLTEMLIAVTLLGIMGAIGIPLWRSADFQKDAAVQTAASTLMRAQNLAVTGQQDVVVTFDTDAGVLRLHEDANRDGVIDGGERTTPVTLPEDMVFGRGGAAAHAVGPGPVTFDARRGGLPILTFHRNGAVSEAGGFYLTTFRAQSAGDRPASARLLTIERATGRVSWFSYGENGWTRRF